MNLARSALAAVTLWPANKKEIYEVILQELERIASKEMSDRDYGRAIAQLGGLDLTRSERRERIHQLEAATAGEGEARRFAQGRQLR